MDWPQFIIQISVEVINNSSLVILNPLIKIKKRMRRGKQREEVYWVVLE